LKFQIEDEGIGIEKENIDNVFKEKWTTATQGEQGHGLGLFICKKIIEAHGGKIGVESKLKTGSKFWFSLPGTIHDSLRSDNIKPTTDLPLIMVVDDDDDLRDVVVWALKADGLQVLSYADPQIAFDQLSSGSIFPAVIIIDYHMGSMTAGDFLKLKEGLTDERLKACPCIIMTAAPQNARRIPGSEKIEILEKPLDLKGLISKVSAICPKSPT